MKTKSILFTTLLTLALAFQSKAQTNSTPPTIPGIATTLSTWFTSQNTNLNWQDITVWDGPVYLNNVNIANELGGSCDLWRSGTNTSSMLFAAAEGRTRQAGIAGIFASQNLGGEFGWMTYDIRLGCYLDGVYRNDTTVGDAHTRLGVELGAFAREGDSKTNTRRLLAADRFNAGDVVASAIARFHTLGLSALFIDERPLVNEARSIALALNGLQQLNHWPRIANERDAYVTLPGGLTWDGKNSRWRNLKCAVVHFTKNKLGAGIEQGIAFFEEGGQTKFVPLISCNRFESIDRVVREFLTPTEGVVDVVNGKVRENPALLLPRLTPGHPPILDLVDAHLITGSEREKETDGSLGDYVDGCENHFLLADCYSKLAEIICEKSKSPPFAFTSVGRKSPFASLPSNIFGMGKLRPSKGIFG